MIKAQLISLIKEISGDEEDLEFRDHLGFAELKILVSARQKLRRQILLTIRSVKTIF